MQVAKHYKIDIAENYCREIYDQFGEKVFNDLLEAVVEETEATYHGAHDHTPSDEMYYVRYKENYDGLPLIGSDLGSVPNQWWVGSEMLKRFEIQVDKLYGPVAFDCYEEGFEVNS